MPTTPYTNSENLVVPVTTIYEEGSDRRRMYGGGGGGGEEEEQEWRRCYWRSYKTNEASVTS